MVILFAPITLTQIDERLGDVEYYKLNGVKVDKPTQPGVYLVKKDGETKMIERVAGTGLK